MTEALLRLLQAAHPYASPGDLLAMLEATPDAPTKAAGKPVQRRVGSRPRSSASMERRRSWAAGGWLPPQLASRFTLAEAAVLAVIAEQIAAREACELPLERIAAVAGVCRTTVRNALRQAKALGILHVEERRQSAWRNLPHRITVFSPEWRAWLRLRSRRSAYPGDKVQGGGRKSVRPTTLKIQTLSESSNGSKGFRIPEARVGRRTTRI